MRVFSFCSHHANTHLIKRCSFSLREKNFNRTLSNFHMLNIPSQCTCEYFESEKFFISRRCLLFTGSVFTKNFTQLAIINYENNSENYVGENACIDS